MSIPVNRPRLALPRASERPFDTPSGSPYNARLVDCLLFSRIKQEEV